MSNFDEESEIFGYFTFSRELGYYLLRKQRFKEAIKSFDNAINLEKNDKRAISGRIRTLIKLPEIKQALKEINKHRKLHKGEPLFLLALKAYCTKICSNFEDAMLMNCCGYSRQRKPDVFDIGAKQCASLIHDAIGYKNCDIFHEHYSLLYDRDHQENILYEKQPAKPINDLTFEIHLRQIYHDLSFSKNLKLDGTLNSNLLNNNKRILNNLDANIKALRDMQDTFRDMRPVYALKRIPFKLSESLKVRQQVEVEKIHDVIELEVYGFFADLVKEMEAVHLINCHEIAISTKSFIMKKPKRILPEKERLIEELYDLFADSILSCFYITEDDFLSENRILGMLGFCVSREVRKDPIIRAYKSFKHALQNHRTMIMILEKAFKKSKNSSEKVWCAYFLSLDYFERKKFAVAQFYGKKCMFFGKKVCQTKWMIIGSFMQARALIQRQNVQNSTAVLIDAIGFAKSIGNEQAAEFLRKILDVITRLDFTEIIRELDRDRGKDILKLVQKSPLKRDFQLLFKHIRNLSPEFRLKLKPGEVHRDYSRKKRPKFHRRSRPDSFKKRLPKILLKEKPLS